MKKENLYQIPSFNRRTEGIYSFSDETRAIIGNVIAMEGEKNGVPVEVAMIYNTSFQKTYTLM